MDSKVAPSKMNAKTIKIFDTTLRDGSQGEKISFSVEDKLRIATRLDDFGIHYVEGGWPGSNPKDVLFFERAKRLSFKRTKLVAFGSTLRAGNRADKDANLKALLRAETPTVAIFGKSWLLHVQRALRISPQENLELIAHSVAYLKSRSKEVIYDAEHFFDGWRDDPDYALQTLLTAERNGADILVLCDTNGGTLTSELSEIVSRVHQRVQAPLGIHAHNDSELAVANTLAAVDRGCEHVQGTINGYGERCGNANLCSVIPNLQIKMGYACLSDENLTRLSALSSFVNEVANVLPNHNAAFVGKSAFAHKGGVHVSAVMKDARTYEHVTPEQIGNRRRVLVSDLSGRSNVLHKAKELLIDLTDQRHRVQDIVRELKTLEYLGYQYEAAEASFKLLLKKMLGDRRDFFRLEGLRVITEKNASGESRAEATIRVNVNGSVAHTVSEGNGPVHALDKALRKALAEFYPEIEQMQLTDYKVRVLDEKEGTAAKVRVLLESGSRENCWGTVGVSENIIDASWQALMDSFSYFLLANRTSESRPEDQQRDDFVMA